MDKVFKKLNLKDHRQILVVNAPASFEPQLDTLGDISVVRDPAETDTVAFSLVFVSRQAELDSLSQSVADMAIGDAVIWFAYPKKTSKKYTCEFDRDSGWHVLGSCGFEAVRQVAIDQDWSALRFRRVAYIRSIKRDPRRALSDEGKKRSEAKRR